MTCCNDYCDLLSKKPRKVTTGPLSTRTQLRLGRMVTFTEQLTNGLPGCDAVHQAMEETVEAKGRLLVELLARRERRTRLGLLE